MRPYIAIFYLFLISACTSTKGQNIIYDLPEKVSQHAQEYLKQHPKEKFIAQLATNPDGSYNLFIIKHDFSQLQNFQLLEKELIQKTARKIKLGKTLLPLLFNEDFIYADLGSVKTKDGRIAKKRIMFNHESYSIRFDKRGNIL